MIPTTDAMAIARAEAELARIDGERMRVQERIAVLRAGVLAHPPPMSDETRAVSAERIALFRSLFRGREDMYAQRWVSAKTRKSGYSPACSREYLRRLWREPELRAQPRPSAALLPLTDTAIREHLAGHTVLGVYPLLTDETCRFLAVDFDGKAPAKRRRLRLPNDLRAQRLHPLSNSAAKIVRNQIVRQIVRNRVSHNLSSANSRAVSGANDWWADVQAFAVTCAVFRAPIVIERSRSGNGAHAWVFFTEPVPAATARIMGSFLITETMERRHELTFASYDRLFPNQNTMPEGGFGNLIALPLQGDVVPNGNSVFVDDAGTPYADQWTFLSSVHRMTPAAVEAIAVDARQHGRIIGVRVSETDADDAKPWDRPPSRTPKRIAFCDPLPSTIHAVRASRLFIPMEGLPLRTQGRDDDRNRVLARGAVRACAP